MLAVYLLRLTPMMFDYSGSPYILCVMEMLRIQELYFFNLHYIANYLMITEKKYNVYQ